MSSLGITKASWSSRYGQVRCFPGKPGSGKGTQAQYFSRYYGWIQLSTGELFRKHLKEKTVLGSKVEEFVEKGDLVPDDVTFSLVKDFLDKAGADSRIIFDGFPRNENQAKMLDDWSENTGAQLLAAVEFSLPDEEALRRLLNRYYCPTVDMWAINQASVLMMVAFW